MGFKNLFAPGRIGGLELKNRIVMPAIAVLMAGEDGEVTDAVVRWYARRARGGAGLVMVETCSTATAVNPLKLHEHMMRVDGPRYLPGMVRLARAIHEHGARAGIQLTPGGGTSDIGGPWIPGTRDLHRVTPSGIPPPGTLQAAYGSSAPEYPLRALETAEIERTVALSGTVAGYVKEAGFDLIEIHAHYGYLIAEFLSPYYNRRTDRYGGSPENRLRFLLEIAAAMKQATGPGFPVVVKYSIDEYIEGGRGVAESQAIAGELEKAGVDGIAVSAGVAGSKMPANPPYFFPRGCWVHLARAIKKVVNIPVIVPGRLHDPGMAEKVLRDGKADFIAVGRGLIADPDWAQKAASGAVKEIRWCLGCNECRQSIVIERQPIRCAVNAAAGREGDYDAILPAATKKKVVIVGGGPSGMEAARVAALRGHEVTILEKRRRLGGLMALAGVHNEEITHFTLYLIRQVKELPIDIRLNTEATPAMLQEMKPDAVILAVGGSFPAFAVPGSDRNNVFRSQNLLDLANGIPLKKGLLLTLLTTLGAPFITASAIRRFLATGFPIKRRVAVIGGQFAGCSLALALAMKGKQVTLIEQSDRIGRDVEATTMMGLNDEVEKGNVRVLTASKVAEITAGGIVVINENGMTRLCVDTVIVAPDLAPSTSNLAEELKGKVKEVYAIGDARSFGRIKTGIAEGFVTARNL